MQAAADAASSGMVSVVGGSEGTVSGWGCGSVGIRFER